MREQHADVGVTLPPAEDLVFCDTSCVSASWFSRVAGQQLIAEFVGLGKQQK
jgi:hypothetical protein